MLLMQVNLEFTITHLTISLSLSHSNYLFDIALSCGVLNIGGNNELSLFAHWLQASTAISTGSQRMNHGPKRET